jgi:hypothetical protein
MTRPRLRVHAFSVSADGCGPGPAQSLQQPMGEGGRVPHGWALATRTLRSMPGLPGEGQTGVDDVWRELHVAVAPVLPGRGEALWPGLDLPALGYRVLGQHRRRGRPRTS